MPISAPSPQHPSEPGPFSEHAKPDTMEPVQHSPSDQSRSPSQCRRAFSRGDLGGMGPQHDAEPPCRRFGRPSTCGRRGSMQGRSESEIQGTNHFDLVVLPDVCSAPDSQIQCRAHKHGADDPVTICIPARVTVCGSGFLSSSASG